MEIGAASLKKSRSALAKLISLESLLQEHQVGGLKLSPPPRGALYSKEATSLTLSSASLQSYCYSDPALLDLLEHWKQERAEAR